VPFTFLAHQAPVLPLKLARPSWFSGTALVIGSMAPDFEYFLRGDPTSTLSHTLLGQVVFCLPLSLALVLVVERLLAPTVPQHLPDLGVLHVRDYGALAHKRRGLGGWLVVATSALIGSFSHIAWDGFTHGHGWAVALRRRLVRAWRGERAPSEAPKTSRTALIATTTIGLALGVALALALGAHDDDALRAVVCVFLRATTGGFAGLCLGCGVAMRAPRSA